MAGELSHRRLVTIVGPGGVGKTTAAVTIAQALRTDFDGHAYFVDLAPIQNPAHVVTAISSLLGLGVYSRDPMLGLAFHLNDRRTLIVLDNCEHVIEAVAEAAEALLTATPKVHVLATTREPLRAAGEWVRRLAPLKSSTPIEGAVGSGGDRICGRGIVRRKDGGERRGLRIE